MSRKVLIPAIAMSFPSAAATAQPTLHALGVAPGSSYSVVRAISPDGTVPVGNGQGGGAGIAESPLWWPDISAGAVILQGSPPYWQGAALSASNAGATVVGWGQIGDGGSGTPVRRAFRSTVSGLTFLNGLSPDDWTYAHAITPDGSTIVGGTTTTACIWTGAATPTPLAPPPGGVLGRAMSISADASRIAGTYRLGSRVHIALWTNGVAAAVPLPVGDYNTFSVDLSLDGSTVVGEIGEAGQLAHSGFVWTEATGPMLLPGSRSALAVSADGSVIGGEASVGTDTPAAIWLDGQMHLVSEYLSGLGVDVSDWTFDNVTGISADGLTLAGSGVYRYGDLPSEVRTEGWVITIPAPGAASALLVGLVLVSRRRR